MMSANEATPPESPCPMPVQSLHRAPAVNKRYACTWRTRFARLTAFGGAMVIGTAGTWQLKAAFGHNANWLQYMLLVLFSLTFYWIALSATTALAGIFAGTRRRESSNADTKVALVMPVYGEDPGMTGAALLAMAQQLATYPESRRFEIFMLSDTQSPDAWCAEAAGYAVLRRHSPLPVYYRRREKNTARKVGNIEDFIRRWGGRYDYMMMLDADSIMDGNTLIRMLRRIDADSQLGLLQTMPRLTGGQSLLARTIEFAGALYGPIVARGVDAWQGEEGNYWGHNAVIRIRAFAGSCGLPKLRGKRPVGGYILSHDFVEAALLCRAGWKVRMDSDLNGSYEGLPPTLNDLAARERRWAQGNLQHLGVIGAKGLRLSNRIHFVIGIFSYLMSPIWLAMLLIGGLLTAQTLLFPPEYFTAKYQLFPNWPTFDAQRMRMLFFAALALLLLPKCLGLLRALLCPGVRQSLGGVRAIVGSFCTELLISALYAPLMMLMQSHQILDIFLGRDSGWKTQSRTGDVLPWKTALRQSLLYLIAGWLPLILLATLAPNQIIWLSPVLAGLCLSPLLLRHSGNTRIGQYLARLHLLCTPEERTPPEVIRQATALRALFHAAKQTTFADVIRLPEVLQTHISTLTPTANTDRRHRLLAITARAKIDAARDRDEALAFLNAEERKYVAGNAELLRYLHNKANSPE